MKNIQNDEVVLVEVAKDLYKVEACEIDGVTIAEILTTEEVRVLNKSIYKVKVTDINGIVHRNYPTQTVDDRLYNELTELERIKLSSETEVDVMAAQKLVYVNAINLGKKMLDNALLELNEAIKSGNDELVKELKLEIYCINADILVSQGEMI